MRWGRIVMLLTAATLWPSAAFASRGWLAWLEELSGPGPFSGIVVSAPVLCPHDGKVGFCTDLSTRKHLIVVSFGRLGSGDNLRFKDLPDTTENRREVNVLQISGVYTFRMGALDLGAGGELLKFSGDGFDSVYRFGSIPASLSLRRLRRSIPGITPGGNPSYGQRSKRRS